MTVYYYALKQVESSVKHLKPAYCAGCIADRPSWHLN